MSSASRARQLQAARLFECLVPVPCDASSGNSPQLLHATGSETLKSFSSCKRSVLLDAPSAEDAAYMTARHWPVATNPQGSSLRQYWKCTLHKQVHACSNALSTNTSVLLSTTTYTNKPALHKHLPQTGPTAHAAHGCKQYITVSMLLSHRDDIEKLVNRGGGRIYIYGRVITCCGESKNGSRPCATNNTHHVRCVRLPEEQDAETHNSSSSSG